MPHAALLLLAGTLIWPFALPAQDSTPEAMTPVGYVPHPEWFKQSFLELSEDLDEANEAGRHLMLYFYQDGCPYCKLFIENNLGQHDIAEYAKAHLDVIAINIFGALEVTDMDGELLPERDFAMKAGIMFTPTLLTFAPDGSVAFRMNGYYPPPKFRAAMRFIAEKRYATERFIEFHRTQDEEVSSGTLHVAEATIEGPPYDLSGIDAPLMVMFEQKECLDCDELHTDILQRKETRTLLQPFAVAVLDIRANDPMKTPSGTQTDVVNWSAELGIKGVPTQVFFYEGQEVFRSEGYIKAFHVQSMLDYVASQAWRETPDFQRYLQGRADRLREQGIAVKLMD